MPYIDCPSCRLRLHSGVLYSALDVCPRCGTRLYSPHVGPLERALRFLFPGRRPAPEQPDWEQITSAQYADRHYVSREEPPGRRGDGKAAA
jgi:Zn-finger nucleic acid-binding protein